VALLRISLGHDHEIRPSDLVGAIAGEANISSRVLGAIKIHDDHSLVEVPLQLVDRIVAALKATKIKGHRVAVQSRPAR
jgi:ATP-dependent RNA helicase DeaD